MKAPGADEKVIAPLGALPVDQSGLGNLEGKELRFGPSAGATFSAVTTAVTCGSVNCMHDSLNPLAGITPMAGMMLNCVFGGKGVGMINMLIYLIIGVFLAGLMVGRTPEYLGKKVEAREMKLAMLAFLIHPIMVLGPAGLFAARDWGKAATNNPGAHGFSEILYEFASSSANNGSGFEGLGGHLWVQRLQEEPEHSGNLCPSLGHCDGLGDADLAVHPDHHAPGLGRRAGRQEADAVHVGDYANRHDHVRVRLARNGVTGRSVVLPPGHRPGTGRGTLRADAVRPLSLVERRRQRRRHAVAPMGPPLTT